MNLTAVFTDVSNIVCSQAVYKCVMHSSSHPHLSEYVSSSPSAGLIGSGSICMYLLVCDVFGPVSKVARMHVPGLMDTTTKKGRLSRC